MTDLGEPKAMRSNEYLDAEELAWTENKVHDLERAIREIQAWQSSSGVSNEPEHQAKKLYNGRASFEFVKNGIFQTDGFAVIVNRQTIAECEDSEVADWICNAWNTRQAMTDLGESKAVPERWRSDFDGMWKDADGCWVSYEDFAAAICEQAQTIERLTKICCGALCLQCAKGSPVIINSAGYYSHQEEGNHCNASRIHAALEPKP